MKKRVLSAVLALLLLAAAGCTSAPASGASSVAESKTESTAEATDGEKVSFSVVFLKNEWHGEPAEMQILQKLEEEANVSVDWDVYASATWPDKKNMMIAGGTLPDVFYMNSVNVDDVNKYASQGMFMDLTELIDAHAPRLKAALEEMPKFKAICVNPDDGKIYSIGRAAEREVQYLSPILYMNKPWLDELGLKIPTTTDEFYTVLKAFKEKDPNRNQKADEIPFTFHYNAVKPDDSYSYHSLFGSFGQVDTIGGQQHFIKNEKDEIVYAAAQPEYQAAVSFYSKFVAEGLWDKEGFTTPDTSVMNAKGNSETPVLGSFMSYDSTFVVPDNRVKEYVVVPPLAGPDGDKLWLYSGHSNGNVNGTQFVMTKQAKGKEEAIMRWLDAHFDPENSAQLFLGAEDITLKKNNSGMLEYIPTPEGVSYSEFRYKNAPVHVPCVIKAADWGKTVQVMAEDVNKLQIAKDTYFPQAKQSSIYLLPNKKESDFFLKKGKDITDYVNKMQVKWLTEGGIEADWENYLTQLTKLGIEEYTQIVKDIDGRMHQ